jgi:acetyltransferase-like isoleucine patch superfamily enzyme
MSIKHKGKYTYGQEHITIRSWGEGYNVYIGNFCSIANNITIYVGGNHRSDWITTYPFGHINKTIFTNHDGKGHPSSNGDVVIGNDVWIGANVTIMSGITIGDGAVLANNSHIVKNVEPYSIVGGNPGRHIKYRFTEEQIKKLLDIKWWNWEESKINSNLNLLCNSDIDLFINANLLLE